MDEKARFDILKQKKECLGSSSSVEKKGKGRSVFKLTSNHLLLSFPLLPSFLPKSTNKKVEIHYLSYLVPDCADPYFSLPPSSAVRAPPKIKVVEGRTLPSLPVELLDQIFALCPTKTQKKLSLLSKAFHQVSSSSKRCMWVLR